MSKRVRIKFCGMTRQEDISYAAMLGVDAIGLIFAQQSSRFISLSQAKKILINLPPFLDVIAVLVNPSQDFVYQIINELAITALQFHGNESPEFCSQFAKPYIKAMQVISTETVTSDSRMYPTASAFLLDTPSSESYGGTGQIFNWDLIPKNLPKPIILAGGLNAANVKTAIDKCSPYAVDICSGIEASPGIKDHQKMQLFVNALWGNE